jgi:hypothetical protein
MSVLIRKAFIWLSAAGLIGVLACVGGCESFRSKEATGEQAHAEVDAYRQISDLEEKRQALEEEVQQQKDRIRALAEEHGAGHLDSRLKLQVQKVAAVMEEIVKIEANRTRLEVEVEILGSVGSKSPDQVKRLEEAQVELQMVRTLESRMQDILTKEDTERIELGRRKLELDDLEEQLAATKRELEKVTKAILELQ